MDSQHVANDSHASRRTVSRVCVGRRSRGSSRSVTCTSRCGVAGVLEQTATQGSPVGYRLGLRCGDGHASQRGSGRAPAPRDTDVQGRASRSRKSLGSLECSRFLTQRALGLFPWSRFAPVVFDGCRSISRSGPDVHTQGRHTERSGASTRSDSRKPATAGNAVHTIRGRGLAGRNHSFDMSAWRKIHALMAAHNRRI